MRFIAKLVVINLAVSIAFLSASAVHTLMVAGQEGFVEVNPMVRANPLLMLSIAPFLFIALVYISWKIDRLTAVCISSVLLGFTAFDLYTHIYLVI